MSPTFSRSPASPKYTTSHSGSRQIQSNRPAGARNVFVDAYNHRIHALDANGKTLFDWGGKWRGALGIGPFKVPAGLAIDQDGGMHVADSANKRAVLLGPRGNFLAAWKLVDPTGDVFTEPRGNGGRPGLLRRYLKRSNRGLKNQPLRTLAILTLQSHFQCWCECASDAS